MNDSKNSETDNKAMNKQDKIKGKLHQSGSAKPEKNSNSEVTKLSEKIKKLEAELESSKEKADKNWDIALRAKAEAENIVRRSKIDVENAHKYSVEKLARELLQVIDSLEMGLNSAKEDNESVASLKQGMELTYKLFLDTLDKFGIKLVDPTNKPFDPKQHEALSMQESPDHKPNTVVTVVQKGFTLNDRILRPARVIVAKGK